MKMLVIIAGSVFVLSSPSLFAFNPEACKGEFGHKFKGSTFISSTTDGTTYLSDVTSFPYVVTEATSSTNGCSPVNKEYGEILNFFLVNFNTIKIESAKGSGEYTLALAEMFRCNGRSAQVFQEFLKSNYEIIFEQENESQSDAFEHIKYLSGKKLKRNCYNVGVYQHLQI